MAAPKGMNTCRSQGDFCLSEGQMDKQKIPGLYRTLSPLEPLPERSDEEVKDGVHMFCRVAGGLTESKGSCRKK